MPTSRQSRLSEPASDNRRRGGRHRTCGANFRRGSVQAVNSPFIAFRQEAAGSSDLGPNCMSQLFAKMLVDVRMAKETAVTLSTHMTLNDGNTIPRLGLGVWCLADGEAPELVADPIDAGYRHIDTTQAYQNENGG